MSVSPWEKYVYNTLHTLGELATMQHLSSATSFSYLTGLHTQKAYTHTGTSSPQILMLSAHAYMHFACELQLDSQCVHHGVRIQV